MPNLSVLYLDAHADLRDEYMGSAYSHACAARRIWEMCPLVEVGVRSMSLEEAEFIRAGRDGLRVIQHGEGGRAASWDAAAVLEGLTEHVYVSIDLDVFDPALMAAVGTPEPGGPGWEAVLEPAAERSAGSARWSASTWWSCARGPGRLRALTSPPSWRTR